MNRKYVINPANYAIGENEKLYADMAAKGWLLEKRGFLLSRFRRAEPAHLRYRIELAFPDTLNGEKELPEEQLALYKECGWSYVAGHVDIHVFSAPEDSDAPEIYTDPRQQAATLKGLRRRYYFSWIPLIIVLPVNVLLNLIMTGGTGSILEKSASALSLGWINYTALFLLYAFTTLWVLYASLHGAKRVAQLHRKLKCGQPIDHAPKKRRRLHRIVSTVILSCCAVCLVLSAWQWSQNKKYDIPHDADGPYLLLEDLGWDGERTQFMSTYKSNYVQTKHSLLSNQWYTKEYVFANGHHITMNQQIFELRDKKMVQDAVASLMTFSTFTRNISGFKRVDLAGLDAAYTGNQEYIAVKGTTVYFMVYLYPGYSTTQDAQLDILVKLAEMDR